VYFLCKKTFKQEGIKKYAKMNTIYEKEVKVNVEFLSLDMVIKKF